MADPFVDRLIDWKAFERFVADMYEGDHGLVVEHNVTEAGKSGAKRQIDGRTRAARPRRASHARGKLS